MKILIKSVMINGKIFPKKADLRSSHCQPCAYVCLWVCVRACLHNLYSSYNSQLQLPSNPTFLSKSDFLVYFRNKSYNVWESSLAMFMYIRWMTKIFLRPKFLERTGSKLYSSRCYLFIILFT